MSRTHSSFVLVIIAAACCCKVLNAGDALSPRAVVAVIPIQLVSTDGKSVLSSDGVTRGLEDALLANLSEISHVSLVERGELERAFREQNLLVAGLVDATGTTAANAGALLKADLIVLGRVRAVGKEFNAVFRVISCKNGEVLGACEVQGAALELARQAGSIAGEIDGACQKLRSAVQATVSAPQAALGALKHHERALALKGAKVFEEAAMEELLALSVDASMNAADEGFLDALAKAGFPELAKAEAQIRVLDDKTRAQSPLLRELAALSDSPPPAAAPIPESLNIETSKRLAEWFDQQGRAGNLDAQRDACMVWMFLGDQYAEKGRDGPAMQAYAQGMRRLRQLRALDPRVIGDWNFNFQSRQIPPAERLIEILLQARYSGTSYTPVAGHQALWDEVLRAPVFPEGAVQSLPAYEIEIPIIDQVYLPVFTQARARANAEYNYLFQIDWAKLPAGTIAIRSELRGKERQFTAGFTEVQLIQQRWVGAEATLTHARAGVPWFAVMNSGVHTVSGRYTQSGKLLTLSEAISTSLTQQGIAHGFQNFRTVRADAAPHYEALRIVALFPPGKQPPADARMDAISHAEAGLLAYLKGDKQAAARDWRAARDVGMEQNSKNLVVARFWERVLGACGGAK